MLLGPTSHDLDFSRSISLRKVVNTVVRTALRGDHVGSLRYLHAWLPINTCM